MQIRELNLKELYTAYEVISKHYISMEYEEFEDLIYDMRHIEYKMFGIFERDRLVAYSGASIQTNLYYKRHLYIYELIVDSYEKDYRDIMLSYLKDYAKIAICENTILHLSDENRDIIC